MKNTVITARRKKIELLTLLVCFIIGNLANLFSMFWHFRVCFMPFGPYCDFYSTE